LGRNRLGTAAFRCSRATLLASTACVLLFATDAPARTRRSQAWAETQFAQAEAQRQALNGRAEQSRTRREYETVIRSYRCIVFEAPTSSKADGSAFAVAELTAEMGRHFTDDMALYAAVREYKYLRREYPGSKHRVEALLAIGEIYKNDLGDDADARAALEEFVGRYPHSELLKEAQAELAALEDDAGRHAGAENEAADPARTSGRGEDKSRPEPTGLPRNAPATVAEEGGDAGDRPIRVKNIWYWSAPEYTRIALELEQDVEFESQRIDHPERIFFDLKNARLSSHLVGRSFEVQDGLVKKIRVAQYKPGQARVVIETDNHASVNASLVLNPPRLVIDVHGDENRQGAAAHTAKMTVPVKASAPDTKVVAATEKVPEQAGAVTGPVAQAPKKVVVEADDDDRANSDAADEGSRNSPGKLRGIDSGSKRDSGRSDPRRSPSTRAAREAQPTADGDRSLIRALGLRIGKIVIDPGHGGHDTGTIGAHGLLEKELVLDVSKRLGKLLESRLGAQVVLTRRDDTFIPLETRTAIANQEEADLFVSVHANSSHDADARGVETYYLNFTSSPEALEVAARENAASDKSIHELQDLVKKIALKEKIEESREFASDVQQSLHTGLAVKSPGVRDRGVKKAPFIVLIGANMPSILAEISFLSNPGDEKRLRTPEYRQRIAESLYRGISRYVNGLGGVRVAMEKVSAN
jgi:N-acetylmuramoyl-L-alanine amidase